MPAEQQSTTARADQSELQFKYLDAHISAVSAKLDRKDYTAAWLGLGGTLVGAIVAALVAILTQHLRARQDRDLASERAKLEINTSFVEWHLKQLSELYGPLHALLQQSQSLYRHMNSVLIGKDSAKFRIQKSAGTDRIDGNVFQGNEWVRFRTVLHISEVYGCGYGVEDYFDEISDIGGRMVIVIREKAGYALPEQTDLVPLFGKYLAHQAVLERLVMHHKTIAGRAAKVADGKSASAPPPRDGGINVDDSAVFPGEIQGIVATGYQTIIHELNAWRQKAGSVTILTT
jgi:uncharacterized membrane-anchored protein YhcB (DUF1043 family)